MGDEDDRFALCYQGAHNFEQLFDFLGGEHGAGLIQDKDIGIAVEQLDNFDPLLDADRQIFDISIRVNFQIVLVGNLADLSAAALRSSTPPTSDIFFAQHDIFGDGKDGHQHKMLVHHANPGGNGIAG